jgi:hypothetical protein
MTSAAPDRSVGVVVCAYTPRRWGALVRALASVRAQLRPPDAVVLVIDHDDELLDRARQAFPDVHVVPNAEARGLSGARNTGMQHSATDVVAFLDDDAEADPAWLVHLIGAFDRPGVLGAGGWVEPAWATRRPGWLPVEFDWVVGCSYRGLPGPLEPMRNPIGANMAFLREPVLRAGGFTSGIGRLGTRPLGGEETELAIRLAQADPAGTILHVPAARVLHAVEPDRGTWRYFRSRCWAEGISKAHISARIGTTQGLASERSYATSVLPRGLGRGLRDAAGGDRDGLRRAAAIVAGLGVTAGGYGRGRLRPA